VLTKNSCKKCISLLFFLASKLAGHLHYPNSEHIHPSASFLTTAKKEGYRRINLNGTALTSHKINHGS
jgi:hypothetical protein